MLTAPLNREELAWAAGFFDGEGHSRLPKESPPTLKVVQCGVYAQALLERFKLAVHGLGNVYGPYKTKWQDRYTWQSTNFEEAQAVMAMLWPFLGPAKRAQMKVAFGEYKQRREVRPYGQHLAGKNAKQHVCPCGKTITGPSFYRHRKVCSVANLHR